MTKEQIYIAIMLIGIVSALVGFCFNEAFLVLIGIAWAVTGGVIGFIHGWLSDD